jgi:nitroreductase
MNTTRDPFYGAPTAVVVFEDTSAHTGHEDACMVMANLLNAAHAIGLASCWINRGKQMFELPEGEEIKKAWAEYVGEAQRLELPLAPAQFLTYFEEDNRPQTNLDRDLYGGMGISIGRLREDTIFDYKFVCLSHNTLRGAAGGAVLGAELLYRQGYLY